MIPLSLDRLRLVEFFEKHFDNRRAAVLCLLIAVLNKSLIAWLYTDLEGDKSLYLLFAKTILEGHHPLEPLGLMNGQQNYFYNGAITSPLYTLIALPFLWLTNSYTTTSFIIDVFAWSLFFTGLYRFSLLLVKGRWISNLLLLCTGFFLYPHEMQSGPKDTLAIGLILWACAGIIHFYKKPVVAKSLLLSLIIIALALAKFLYVPVAFLFVIALWGLYFRTKRKDHLQHAIFITSLCLIAGLAFYSYLNYLKGLQAVLNMEMPIHKQEAIRGFSPQNLKRFFPSISSSVININFWCTQLSDIFNTSYKNILTAFQALDLLLLFPLVLFFRKLLQNKGKLAWLTGIVTSVVIIGLLSLMSAFHKPTVYEGGSTWTYIAEARSFLFVIVFLQVVLFYLIFRSNTQVLLKNFLLLLFLIECLHGLYLTTKQTMNNNAGHSSADTPVKKINRMLVKANEQPSSTVILSTPHSHLRQYAQLFNHPVAYFNNECAVLQQANEHSLLLVNFEKESSTLDTCITDRMLLTTDLVAPFVLKLYSR